MSVLRNQQKRQRVLPALEPDNPLSYGMRSKAGNQNRLLVSKSTAWGGGFGGEGKGIVAICER